MNSAHKWSLYTLLSLGASAGAAVQAAEAPPNIVFIMADDCTFRDIGCYGGQAYTPRIDAFAKEAMKFNRCFQAAPMCSPTRHNIYTGLYPVHSGAYPNHTFAKAGTKSLAHYLGDLGYRVALSGKRHISPKSVFPFEYSGKKNNPDMKAIDTLVRECRDAGQPFCLLATSHEPHTPWNKGDPSQYDPKSVVLPPYCADTPLTRTEYCKYLAEITFFDGQVGRILDILKKYNADTNTLVMIVSEQGQSLPFAKWTCYDNGLHSIMLVRWPGRVQPGSQSDALVEYVDICPTFIEAAGGKVPSNLDGKSFIPVLSGKTDHHKDYVYGIMTTRGIHDGSDCYPIRSVRSDDFLLIKNLNPDGEFQNTLFKNPIIQEWQQQADQGDRHIAGLLHRYHKRPPLELYDVRHDPYNLTNLADRAEYAPVIKDLERRLTAWMDEQGDRGVATELEAEQHQVEHGK